VLVVSWTVAEAVPLAMIFTPGVPLSQWFEYTHNVDVFIPKVTGPKAPFNDPKLAPSASQRTLRPQCRDHRSTRKDVPRVGNR